MNNNPQLPRSWTEAVQLYLHDPHALKLLRRFAYRFLPIATGIVLVDDFLVPIIGVVDNISLPFLIGGIIVMVYKINKYRYSETKQQPGEPRKYIPSQ